MAARKTAAELAAEVKIAEVRQATPLESYYVTAEHILRQANVYRAEGNEAQLFLKLVTFCSLVSETLPKHRDYLQPRYASDKARYIKFLKAKLTEVEALRDALNSRARLAGEGARGGALDVASVLPPSLSVPHAPPPRSWEQPHAGDAPVAAAQAGLTALSCGAESPLPTSSPPAFFIPPARQATRDKHALLPSRSGESDLWTSHGASSTAAASPQPPPQPPHSSLMDVFNESYARHAGPTAGPITGHTAGPTPPPLSPGHRAVELPPGDLVDVLASGAPRAAPRTDVCVPSADDARADHARLHERLRLYGLREKTISGDGNCQFRALADQLWRDPARHAEVRARVMQQLRGDGESYEVFVTESWEGYLARMGTLGTWGDHLTLQAAADAYNVKLCLLTSYRDSFVVDVHYNSLYKA